MCIMNLFCYYLLFGNYNPQNTATRVKEVLLFTFLLFFFSYLFLHSEKRSLFSIHTNIYTQVAKDVVWRVIYTSGAR